MSLSLACSWQLEAMIPSGMRGLNTDLPSSALRELEREDKEEEQETEQKPSIFSSRGLPDDWATGFTAVMPSSIELESLGELESEEEEEDATEQKPSIFSSRRLPDRAAGVAMPRSVGARNPFSEGLTSATELQPLGELECEDIEEEWGRPQMSQEPSIFSIRGLASRVAGFVHVTCRPGLLPGNSRTALEEISAEDWRRTGPWGTILHVMIARYPKEVVEAAVELLPDSLLPVVDEAGQTVLHVLARFGGTTAAVQRLIERMGVDALATPNKKGSLPLHFAVQLWSQQLDEEFQETILRKTPTHALAQCNSYGESVLHLITKAPRNARLMEAALPLLPKELLVARDVRGRAPLHTAAEEGYISMALLDSASAEMLMMEDDSGMCALELAFVGDRHVQVKSGWAQNDDTSVFVVLVEAYKKKAVFEKKAVWQTTSPLHLLMAHDVGCGLEIFTDLPQAREWAMIADPVTGMLPLHFLANKSSMFSQVDLGPVLRLMAPQDLAMPVVGSSKTALHLAILNGNNDSARQLLDVAEATFDVDAPDAEASTLIASSLATRKHRRGRPVAILKRLLNRSKSHYPLTVAQWRKLRDFFDVSLLVAVCARYESDFWENSSPAEWEGGSTPLHCACHELHLGGLFAQRDDDPKEYKKNLLELLEIVPEWFVTVRDGKGFTPLLCAATKGNAVAVEILMDLPSASKAAEMSLGKHGSPLEIAIKQRDSRVVKAILWKMPNLRYLITESGETVAEMVNVLHSNDPDSFAEIKQMLTPPPKSAAI